MQGGKGSAKVCRGRWEKKTENAEKNMEEERLNDKDIRKVIFRTFSGNSDKIRIIEEFPMGDSRADLLLITQTKLIGLEIKSDRDTFVRLPRQIKDYERYFDYNYLVVGTYHVEEAMREVPKHWGIYEVYEAKDGSSVMECVREAKLLLKDNLEDKLFLLWKNELQGIIREYGISTQVFHRKEKMIDKIGKGLSGTVIQKEICDALIARDYSKYGKEGLHYNS